MGDLQAAGCYIVICLYFLNHGLQFLFHRAGDKESGCQANHQSYNHISHQLERFFGKIVCIERITGLCLRKELIAQICKCGKSLRIFTIRQIRDNFFADVFDTGIGKSGDTIAGGGYPPVAFLI